MQRSQTISETASAEEDNWDEDFEFSQDAGDGINDSNLSPRLILKSEDWDAMVARVSVGNLSGQGKRQSDTNPLMHLGRISEKPSIATILNISCREPEDWNEDFESASGSSENYQHESKVLPSHSDSSVQPLDAPLHHASDVAGYSSHPLIPQYSNEDEDGDFGASADGDEELTITGRLRGPQTRPLALPPVPNLPSVYLRTDTEPFPLSRTLSALSGEAATLTDHPSTSATALVDRAESSYHSTSHDEEPKERRRLRKKSRPRHLHEYNDTFELIYQKDIPSSSSALVNPVLNAHESLAEQNNIHPKSKSFLSRVGSWGGPKKRKGSGATSVEKLATGLSQDRTFASHDERSGSSDGSPTSGWFSKHRASRHHDDEACRRLPGDMSLGKAPKINRKVSLAQLPPSQDGQTSSTQIKRRSNRLSGDEGQSRPRRSTSSKRPSSSSSSLNFSVFPLLSRGVSKSSRHSGQDEVAKVKITASTSMRDSDSAHRTHRSRNTIDTLPILPAVTLPSQWSNSGPPIELQPPSPAEVNEVSENTGIQGNGKNLAVNSSPGKTAISQAASLGRNSPQYFAPDHSSPIRRSSLGDLKIPSRISQAQNGLKRDLGLVKNFAAKVEVLRNLQITYRALLKNVQNTLDSLSPSPPARASTSFTNLSRPTFRARSNTSSAVQPTSITALLLSVQENHEKYRLPWECAELLVEMGSGTSTNPHSKSDAASEAFPFLIASKTRERAITLSGNQAQSHDINLKALTPSTGKNDLSHRQLVLLRDMLHYNDEGAPPQLEGTAVNKAWQWGDAMASQASVASEVSITAFQAHKRKSRLGLLYFRDILKALRPAHSRKRSPTCDQLSATSSENESNDHGAKAVKSKNQVAKGRAAVVLATSVGVKVPHSAYLAGHRPSPRRPSLANLFRMGQRKVSVSDVSNPTSDVAIESSRLSQDSTEEEDWDHTDSSSEKETKVIDRELPGGTMKNGRSPYLQARKSEVPSTRQTSASRSSLLGGPSSPFNSLTGFASHADPPVGARSSISFLTNRKRGRVTAAPLKEPSDRISSVRSAPHSTSEISHIKLAMTPENIKPLLENACELQTQLEACVEALRLILTKSTAPVYT